MLFPPRPEVGATKKEENFDVFETWGDAVEAISGFAYEGVIDASTKLPQSIGEFPEWLEVVTDPQGNIIEGTLAASSEVDEGVRYNLYGSANPARALPPADIPGWRNVVLDGTGGSVIEGDTTDGTKYFRAIDVDTLKANGRRVGQSVGIAAFGDSMTDVFGTPAVSFALEVGRFLGVNVYQGGRSGQTSTECAFRLGALDLTFTLPAPLVTGPNTLALVEPVKSWSAGARSFTVEVTVAPKVRVQGTLAKSASNVWTFTPVSLPVESYQPTEAIAHCVEGASAVEYPVIFRAGRNNASDADEIVRDYTLVRDWVYANHITPKFLALPIYPSGSPSGSADHTYITGINKRIQDVCGRDYYDLRRWLIKHGLTAAGIPPTSQDLADIAADTIPTSLRYLDGADATHLSAAGRTAEAQHIATLITSRKWM